LDLPARQARQARNAYRVCLVLFFAAMGTALVEYYLGAQSGAWQLFVAATAITVVSLASLLGARLSRRGRPNLAMGFVVSTMLFAIVLISAVLARVGLVLGLTTLLATVAVSTQTLPQKWVNRATLAAVVAGTLAGVLDLAGPPAQLVLPALEPFVLWVTVATIAVYGIFVLRQFRSYSLPSKLIVAFLTVSVASMGAVVMLTDRAIRATLTEEVGAKLQGLATSQALTIAELLDKQVRTLIAAGTQFEATAGAASAAYGADAEAVQAELDRLEGQWQSAGAESESLAQRVMTGATADELRDFVQAFGEHAFVLLTDRYGATIAATGRPAQFVHQREAWWQAAYNDGQGAVYVGSPVVDADSGELRLPFAVPLFADAAARPVVGVLLADYNLESLAETMISAQFGQTGRSDIYLPDGQELEIEDGELELKPTELDLGALTGLQSAAANYVEIAHGGVPSLLSIGTVTLTDREGMPVASPSGWTVVIRQDRDEALSPVDRQARGALLVAVLVGGVMSGLAVVLSQILSMPIARLTSVARRAASGDLTAQVPVETDDEIGTLAVTFNTMTAQLSGLIASLEERVESRTSQLKASADVGRAAASMLDTDRLLREVVNLMADRFDISYAAVFLLDEPGRFAVLREATGEAGRQLKERGHKLEVGGQSMVGAAVATRQPRVALDVGQEAVRFANPFLPDTRSEIALPLIVGDRVLGALDVQSTREAAFDEASMAVLQGVADQVAVALNNALSYTEAQAAARRARALYEASQAIGRLESDLEGTLNAMMRAVSETLGYRHWWMAVFDDRREWLVPLASSQSSLPRQPVRSADTPDTPALRSALYGETHIINDPAGDPRLAGVPAQARAESGKFVSMPIIVRNVSVGAMMLGRPSDTPDLDERDLEVGLSLASLTAIAIENRSLFDQTRRALEEVDAVNRRLTGEAWRTYLAARGEMSFRSGQLSEQATSQTGAPIVVRGETLGRLSLEDGNPDRQWTEEDRLLLNAVAGEVALAIENARLLEETQRRAAREAQLNQIAERIRRAASIESILRVAVDEVGLVLEASHANVRLGQPPAPAAKPNGGEASPATRESRGTR
jgi:GAF domain-containing protein/HAMP domain-containing protein